MPRYGERDIPAANLLETNERRRVPGMAEAAYGLTTPPDLDGASVENAPGGVIAYPYRAAEVWGMILDAGSDAPRYAWKEAVKPSRDEEWTDEGARSGTADYMPFIPVNEGQVLEVGKIYKAYLHESGMHWDVPPAGGMTWGSEHSFSPSKLLPTAAGSLTQARLRNGLFVQPMLRTDAPTGAAAGLAMLPADTEFALPNRVNPLRAGIINDREQTWFNLKHFADRLHVDVGLLLGGTLVAGTSPRTGEITVTRGNPTTINCTGHGLTTGNIVSLFGLQEPYQLNQWPDGRDGHAHSVTVLNSNQFTVPVNSTDWEDAPGGSNTGYFHRHRPDADRTRSITTGLLETFTTATNGGTMLREVYYGSAITATETFSVTTTGTQTTTLLKVRTVPPVAADVITLQVRATNPVGSSDGVEFLMRSPSGGQQIGMHCNGGAHATEATLYVIAGAAQFGATELSIGCSNGIGAFAANHSGFSAGSTNNKIVYGSEGGGFGWSPNIANPDERYFGISGGIVMPSGATYHFAGGILWKFTPAGPVPGPGGITGTF